MFKVRMLIKDNKVVCSSQLCDKKCSNFSKCPEYTIEPRRCKDRKETLSFNYLEKMMSEGHTYKRAKGGAIKQIK